MEGDKVTQAQLIWVPYVNVHSHVHSDDFGTQ